MGSGMKLGVTIHHNGPPTGLAGKPHSACERFWGGVCRYHAQKFGSRWSRSVYSFGVCHHGIRFTGVGWDRNQAANGTDVVGGKDGTDADWYTAFAFIGTDEKPSLQMIAGIRNIIQEGRDTHRCGMRVLPHNRFKYKACPGPELTDLAYAWDNRSLTAAKPTPLPEEDDMHGTDIIASYIEAGHDINSPKTGVAIRAWNHAIYAKPTREERDNGVKYIRHQLGLPTD